MRVTWSSPITRIRPRVSVVLPAPESPTTPRTIGRATFYPTLWRSVFGQGSLGPGMVTPILERSSVKPCAPLDPPAMIRPLDVRGQMRLPDRVRDHPEAALPAISPSADSRQPKADGADTRLTAERADALDSEETSRAR